MDARAFAPERLAGLALALHAVDPSGTGILWIRARAGPLRDRVLALIRQHTKGARKIGVETTDDALFGGLDLSQTLSQNTLVRMPGILERNQALILSSAERCPPRLAAHLSAAVDKGDISLVLLDEGASDEEQPPDALLERAGLFLPLEGWRENTAIERPVCDADIHRAKALYANIVVSDAQSARLVEAAAGLGIASLRPPLIAIAVARAITALAGRSTVENEDLEYAAALVFGHKATVLPDEVSEPEVPPEPEYQDAEAEGDDSAGETELPAEVLLQAAQAALNSDVLSLLANSQTRTRQASGSGAGAKTQSHRRGRPLPPGPGHPDSQRRVDLTATLRTAAPWQPMRQEAANDPGRLQIRSSDLRLKRYEETSDRVLVFAVDASGSQALARLAEAKGAVEILLSEAYARRDHVALIGFRGDGAEMLLPPTRSLVQTKRRLSALPGGGGTPLAAGLAMAAETADRARAQGMTPSLILLTDGRANIALDGTANRAAAAEDAEKVCRTIAARGTETLVIDTGSRPSRQLESLAPILNGTYIALPRADARRLSAAVAEALDT